MDRFLSIQAFVRVAETQSFAEAARQLGTSTSVVTKRVQQLEEFIHAPLFHRTTRNVRLSEVGQAYHQECVEMVHRVNELVAHMREMKGTPAGVLRVHALPGFVLGHMAPRLRRFQELYPEIMLDLVVYDAVIDPVKEGFDCTLQIFPPASQLLVERRLFPVRKVFCASPAYLEQHGAPHTPSDLTQHRLGLYSGYPTRGHWVFYSGIERQTLELEPTLKTNSVHLLRDYALADAAVVCIPTMVAAEDLLAGRLRVLLPQHQLTSSWLTAVYPPTHRRTLKLQLFLESITSNFIGDPPWDKALIERQLIPARLID